MGMRPGELVRQGRGAGGAAADPHRAAGVGRAGRGHRHARCPGRLPQPGHPDRQRVHQPRQGPDAGGRHRGGPLALLTDGLFAWPSGGWCRGGRRRGAPPTPPWPPTSSTAACLPVQPADPPHPRHVPIDSNPCGERTDPMRRHVKVLGGLLALCLLGAACGDDDDDADDRARQRAGGRRLPDGPAISIGAQDFGESRSWPRSTPVPSTTRATRPSVDRGRLPRPAVRRRSSPATSTSRPTTWPRSSSSSTTGPARPPATSTRPSPCSSRCSSERGLVGLTPVRRGRHQRLRRHRRRPPTSWASPRCPTWPRRVPTSRSAPRRTARPTASASPA